MRLIKISCGSLLLWMFGVAVSPSAQAQTVANVGIVGILDGSATLIRQTTRYVLAEGVALNEQDIIEAAPGAFVQIELPGNVLVGIGDQARVMVRPKVGKGLTAPPLYLLQGWLKASTSGPFGYASPPFEIATQAANVVVYLSGTEFEVFVEGGSATLTVRNGGPVSQLAAGDFAQRREGASPTVARRPPAEFLAKVPRQFRDRLPARGDQFAKRPVSPKALGEIAYTDVAAWLRTEPAMRLPLLPLWRARAADPDFRAAARAELARHPEWEPHADPEGYARRMAEEAERRRAREAARRAAAAAAPPAPPAATGAGPGKP